MRSGTRNDMAGISRFSQGGAAFVAFLGGFGAAPLPALTGIEVLRPAILLDGGRSVQLTENRLIPMSEPEPFPTMYLTLVAALLGGYMMVHVLARAHGGWGAVLLGGLSPATWGLPAFPPKTRPDIARIMLSIDDPVAGLTLSQPPTDVEIVRIIFRFSPQPLGANWHMTRGQRTMTVTERMKAAGPLDWKGVHARYQIAIEHFKKAEVSYRDAKSIWVVVAQEALARAYAAAGDSKMARETYKVAINNLANRAKAEGQSTNRGVRSVEGSASISAYLFRRQGGLLIDAAHSALAEAEYAESLTLYGQAAAAFDEAGKYAEAAGDEVPKAKGKQLAEAIRRDRQLLIEDLLHFAGTDEKIARVVVAMGDGALKDLFPPWAAFADLPWSTLQEIQGRLKGRLDGALIMEKPMRAKSEWLHNRADAISEYLQLSESPLLRLNVGNLAPRLQLEIQRFRLYRGTLKVPSPYAYGDGPFSDPQPEITPEVVAEMRSDERKLMRELEEGAHLQEAIRNTFAAFLTAAHHYRLQSKVREAAHAAILGLFDRLPDPDLLTELIANNPIHSELVWPIVSDLADRQPGWFTRELIERFQWFAARDFAARAAWKRVAHLFAANSV